MRPGVPVRACVLHASLARSATCATTRVGAVVPTAVVSSERACVLPIAQRRLAQLRTASEEEKRLSETMREMDMGSEEWRQVKRARDRLRRKRRKQARRRRLRSLAAGGGTSLVGTRGLLKAGDPCSDREKWSVALGDPCASQYRDNSGRTSSTKQEKENQILV